MLPLPLLNDLILQFQLLLHLHLVSLKLPGQVVILTNQFFPFGKEYQVGILQLFFLATTDFIEGLPHLDFLHLKHLDFAGLFQDLFVGLVVESLESHELLFVL